MALNKSPQSITFVYRGYRYLAPFIGLFLFAVLTLILTGLLFLGVSALYGLEENHPWLFVLGMFAVIACCIFLFAKFVFYADRAISRILARTETLHFYDDYFVSERYGEVHCRDVLSYEFRQDNLISTHRIIIYCKKRVIHYALDIRTFHKKPKKLFDVMLMTWLDEEERNLVAFTLLLQRFEKLFTDWNARAYQSGGQETHFIYQGEFFRRPLPIIMGVVTSLALFVGMGVAFFVFKYKLPVLGTLPIVLYLLFKMNRYIWQNIIEAWKKPR